MEKSRLIELYSRLYGDCEVEDRIFDYSILLMRYGNYLHMFFNPDSPACGDIEFLECAIDGFEYFQDLLVGKVSLDDGVVSDKMLKYDDSVRGKTDISLYTQQDFIYAFSMRLPVCFLENGREDLALTYGKKAVHNCYRIIDATEEKGCDKNDVEYWKHRN